VVIGLAVVSHCVLDAISHRPDLPLVPGVGVYVGLGLWNSSPATLIVEGIMFIAGVLLYASQNTPDLVLLDLTPSVTFAVLNELKQCKSSAHIVLWVNSISTELAFQTMGLGVRGILRKTLPMDLQIKCLQKVQAGELWFEKALTDSFLCARRIPLTNREGQLIALLSQGLKNKEIATALMISEGTVKVYLSRLFQKVGVKDRFEMAPFSLKNLSTGPLPATTPMPGLRSIVIDRPAETRQPFPSFTPPMRAVNVQA
jgi:DNA-binding NarL/FixJ family response regulator